MDGQTFVYTVGTTMVNPSAPVGYSWVGTLSDKSALPLTKIPAAGLCNNWDVRYIVIAPGATRVTSAAELAGKTFKRQRCAGDSGSADTWTFNSDGSLAYSEDGGGTLGAAIVAAGLSNAGYSYTDTYNGTAVSGVNYFHVYKFTVDGVTRYVVLSSGIERKTSDSSIYDQWMDFNIDSAF